MSSTSGRLHSEFVWLLHSQAHWETDRFFFPVSGVQFPEPTSGQFHFHRVVFSDHLTTWNQRLSIFSLRLKHHTHTHTHTHTHNTRLGLETPSSSWSSWEPYIESELFWSSVNSEVVKVRRPPGLSHKLKSDPRSWTNGDPVIREKFYSDYWKKQDRFEEAKHNFIFWLLSSRGSP